MTMRTAVIPVLLVTISVTGAAAQEFVPPPNRTGESAWIPLKHQRQERNLCVPTSVSMILAYFGDPMSPREIKALSRNKPYDPDRPFTDFTITMWRDLVAGLERRGYRWRTLSYDYDGAGLMAGWMEITRSLDHRVPVTIDLSTSKGPHTLVVAGYSNAQQVLFTVDPSLAAPGIRKIGYLELGEVWTSRAVGSVRRGLLIPARARIAPASRNRLAWND